MIRVLIVKGDNLIHDIKMKTHLKIIIAKSSDKASKNLDISNWDNGCKLVIVDLGSKEV